MSPPDLEIQSALMQAEDPRNHRGSSLVYSSKQEFHQRLGSRLKAIREQAGLSQEETARLAGINRSYLSQVEGGKRTLSLYLACRLAKALDINLDALLNSLEGGSHE